jgi:uncharacterized protein
MLNDLKGVKMKIEEKFETLKTDLRTMKRVLIAFSGGVDSTFLLKVANDLLGKENVIAVTASSSVRFTDEFESALKIAKKMNAKCLTVKTHEIDDDNFVKNDELRCYYCKYSIFKTLKDIAQEKGIEYVLDGTNYDDVSGDYRPGLKALKEFGIVSPLKDAGLSKKEIRLLSKELGLSTWDKAPETCLATRFPYGIRITAGRLEKISTIESYLKTLDLKVHRARYHDDRTVRIEVLPEEMMKIMDKREEIISKLKALGFNYITLDLEGYRSGSLNEVLKNGG